MRKEKRIKGIKSIIKNRNNNNNKKIYKQRITKWIYKLETTRNSISTVIRRENSKVEKKSFPVFIFLEPNKVTLNQYKVYIKVKTREQIQFWFHKVHTLQKKKAARALLETIPVDLSSKKKENNKLFVARIRLVKIKRK